MRAHSRRRKRARHSRGARRGKPVESQVGAARQAPPDLVRIGAVSRHEIDDMCQTDGKNSRHLVVSMSAKKVLDEYRPDALAYVVQQTERV